MTAVPSATAAEMAVPHAEAGDPWDIAWSFRPWARWVFPQAATGRGEAGDAS